MINKLETLLLAKIKAEAEYLAIQSRKTDTLNIAGRVEHDLENHKAWSTYWNALSEYNDALRQVAKEAA